MNNKWGNWTYDPELNTLDLKWPNGAIYYQLDLDEFTTSAALLDMIFQVAGKAWATPAICRNMLTALAEKVDPQANLCSWGVERGHLKRKKA